MNMELLSRALMVYLVCVLREAATQQDAAADAVPDRCSGVEFDAICPDDRGQTLFFRGEHVWKGFSGPAELTSLHFKELTGRVDAAFRMHSTEHLGDHDHVYLLLGDKVFSYFNQSLEAGFPREIQEAFPGVPSNLDAAVECPKGECMSDSVLFFKGQEVHLFDIATKTVKTKTWTHLPPCTSVLRWLEHYYCFHGNNFTRFHPVSGEVSGSYPKDARHYFMVCPEYGHGGDHRAPKCSDITLNAATADDTGRTYLFTGSVRVDTHRDGIHAFPLSRAWKQLTSHVDAAFSYASKIYFIKGDQVYIYKADAHFTLIDGYPKPLRDELGLDGPVDAAFVCPSEDKVHILQGAIMRDVLLTATPRRVVRQFPLALSNMDAALCAEDGIRLFKGSQFYDYESPKILAMGKIAPMPQNITSAMMGCED